MLPPKLRIVACQFALGVGQLSDLVDAAHDALNRGVYAIGLGEIVTSRNVSFVDLTPWLTSALVELGYPVPSEAEAFRHLQIVHLRSIVEGAVTPAIGFERYYQDCHQPFAYGRGAELNSWEDSCSSELAHHWYALDEFDWRFHLPEEEAQNVAVREVWDATAVELARKWCAEHGRSLMCSDWRTQTVLAIATGVSVDKAFDRLPILADALEEAGCDNWDILFHCREGGQHTSTCWVIDMLLDR